MHIYMEALSLIVARRKSERVGGEGVKRIKLWNSGRVCGNCSVKRLACTVVLD